MKNLHLSILLSAIFFWDSSVLAQSTESESKGLTIAKERKSRDEGWKSSESKQKMILRNSQGQSSVRELRVLALEGVNEGNKTITFFDTPRDVKGTAFLTFNHVNKANDQWLYLPALKRVKRISSRNKSGPFMGSEFSYEDLGSFEVKQYTYNFLRDEMLNGKDCYVIEQTPIDKYSGYTKIISWLDKKEYNAHKVEFYDRKGALLKTLILSDYKKYLNKYWRSNSSIMKNHITYKETEVTTTEINMQVDLNESDFSKTALKRAR
jgi:outer membrane lipoprotein-sorting protein